MFVTILPMHRDRRARARRGRPARSRDPGAGVRDLRADAVRVRRSAPRRPGRCARAPGSTVVAQAGPEALATADTVLVPGFEPHLRVPGRARAGRAARRPRARRAHGLDLHRRVRAGRRRRARRAPRDHPLARRGRPRRPPPARRRRARRALHRRGPGPDERGRRRGPRSLPAHPAPRPRRRAGQHDRAPDRRPAPPRGRPGAVRRAAGARRRRAGRWPRPAPGRSSACTSRSRVRTLAAHAHVSERTFARRFSAETGVPVLRWLLAQRVDAARAALESTDASIDEIAHRCGFGTAANLRKHFHRAVSHHPDGLPPRVRRGLRTRRLAPQQRADEPHAREGEPRWRNGATQTIQPS